MTDLETTDGGAGANDTGGQAELGADVDALFAKALGDALGDDDDEDEGPAEGAFHDDAEAEEERPAKREPAKAKAKREEPDEDDEDAEDEPAHADDSADTEDDEDAELDAATKALRLQGVPWSAIKKTPREELITWGGRAADAIRARNRDLEADARARREPERDAKKATSEAPGAAPTSLDWSVHAKAIADELGVDPSTAEKAFRPVIDAVVEDLTSRFEARLARVDELEQRSQAEEGRRKIDENVRRLKSEHPALRRDHELQEQLIEEASTIAAGMKARGRATTAAECFDKAAAALGLSKSGRRDALRSKRLAGLSHAPDRSGGFGAPASDADSDFVRRMELVEAGKFEQARALPPPQTKKSRNGHQVRQSTWASSFKVAHAL